jgi:hypothetical protein
MIMAGPPVVLVDEFAGLLRLLVGIGLCGLAGFPAKPAH